MKRKTLFKIIATIIIILVVSSILMLRGTSYFPYKIFGSSMSVAGDSDQPLPASGGKIGKVAGEVP